MSSKKSSKRTGASASDKKKAVRSHGHAPQRVARPAVIRNRTHGAVIKMPAKDPKRKTHASSPGAANQIDKASLPPKREAQDIALKVAEASSVGYEGEHKAKMKNLNIKKPEVVRKAINDLLGNEQIAEYLRKNVGAVALDVIGMLATSRTDDYIAEQLGLKINAVRRILNILQGYGITNYYVAKNTNGWLLFAWFINVDKLDSFISYVNGSTQESSTVHDQCNDYFVCSRDFKDTHEVIPFDTAFESNFRCACGGKLKRIDRADAEAIVGGTAAALVSGK